MRVRKTAWPMTGSTTHPENILSLHNTLHVLNVFSLCANRTVGDCYVKQSNNFTYSQQSPFHAGSACGLRCIRKRKELKAGEDVRTVMICTRHQLLGQRYEER